MEEDKLDKVESALDPWNEIRSVSPPRPKSFIYRIGKGISGFCPGCMRTITVGPSSILEEKRPTKMTCRACGGVSNVEYEEEK